MSSFFARLLVLSCACVSALGLSSLFVNISDDNTMLASNTHDADAIAGPRLLFLFMVNDAMPNEDIWASFFRGAKPNQFKAYLHCVQPAECEQNIKGHDVFQIISTVESSYCSNLVDPMIALLQSGIAGKEGSAKDKFVFVSYDAIPVKPFENIYQELIVNREDESDFCLAPVGQWTSVKGAQLVVKHHQWFVLTRSHAELAVANQLEAKSIITSRSIISRVMTCADEFWAYAAVFGRLNTHINNTNGEDVAVDNVTVPGLGGGPLQLTGDRSKLNQGRCDTFVDVPKFRFFLRELLDNWDEFAGSNFSFISRILHPEEDSGEPTPTDQRAVSLTELRGSRHKSGTRRKRGSKGPRRLELLWEKPLRALRDSQFLFARKVSPEYTKVILREEIGNNIVGGTLLRAPAIEDQNQISLGAAADTFFFS